VASFPTSIEVASSCHLSTSGLCLGFKNVVILGLLLFAAQGSEARIPDLLVLGYNRLRIIVEIGVVCNSVDVCNTERRYGVLERKYSIAECGESALAPVGGTLERKGDALESMDGVYLLEDS
jgi:hypothetical protein